MRLTTNPAHFRFAAPRPKPAAFKDPAKVKPKAEGKPQVVWTDLMILDVLDRVEAQGQSYDVIAEAYGTTRNAVAGLVKRIKDDLAESEVGSKVRKKWNRDGVMGRRWWAKARRAG